MAYVLGLLFKLAFLLGLLIGEVPGVVLGEVPGVTFGETFSETNLFGFELYAFKSALLKFGLELSRLTIISLFLCGEA